MYMPSEWLAGAGPFQHVMLLTVYQQAFYIFLNVGIKGFPIYYTKKYIGEAIMALPIQIPAAVFWIKFANSLHTETKLNQNLSTLLEVSKSPHHC